MQNNRISEYIEIMKSKFLELNLGKIFGASVKGLCQEYFFGEAILCTHRPSLIGRHAWLKKTCK